MGAAALGPRGGGQGPWMVTTMNPTPYHDTLLDPSTLWCLSCGRKLIHLRGAYYCVCGAVDPADLPDLPKPELGSMWRSVRHGWIAQVEEMRSGSVEPDYALLEVMAAFDPRTIGTRAWCSLAFLRDKCVPYQTGG